MGCEHHFDFLRQERQRLEQDGMPTIIVRDVYFCHKCLAYQFVEVAVLQRWKAQQLEADGKTDFEKGFEAKFSNDPGKAQADAMETAAGCALSIEKLLADEVCDVEVLAEFHRFASLILKVGQTCELNPDDHFGELIAAKNAARKKLHTRV